MTKEISEGLKKQKQLIKEVINPFFKNNGFSKKGVKYTKTLDYFIIVVEIQRQRYYKDTGVENFRINMDVYSENSYKLFYGSMSFGGCCIQGEGSWITTDEHTDMNELKSWLNTELSKLPPKIEEYKDVDKIIEKLKNLESYNHEYAFLLKDTNRTKELKQWIDNTNKEISKLNSEILDLSQQLELIEKSENKNKLLNEIEQGKLWSERKSRQLRVEFIMRFLKTINE